MSDLVKSTLNKFWGYPSLKPAQLKAVENILSGNDVCCFLPTGSGKSICFQLPAIIQAGVCVVISPLIALMEDQSNDLSAKGISNVVLKSKMPFSDIQRVLDNCQMGKVNLLYLSPERFQNSFIQERLQYIKVSFFAIDEAHCISQWGNDFRPSFRKLHLIRECFPDVPIMALTASATLPVQQDIISELLLNKPKIVQESVIRKNISIDIKDVNDRRNFLVQILKRNNCPTIIYVRSRKLCITLNALLERNGIRSKPFNAGLPLQQRLKAQQDFLTDKISTIVATTAFGMGINKKNIGRVVHFDLPESLENYYQEIGRSGRDHKPAEAVTFYNSSELIRLKKQHIDQLPDLKFMILIYKKIHAYYQIPYHEGKNQTYNLDIIQFARRYGFSSKLVLNALRILEKTALISLKTNHQFVVEMQVIVSPHQIKHLNDHDHVLNVLEAILRSYPGIYEQYLGVNLEAVSRKTGYNQKQIIKSLLILKQKEIADVKIQDKDFIIEILQNYEGDKMIFKNKKLINDFLNYKKRQVIDMINFIKNAETCRQQAIALYFGEKNPGICHNCYVCRSSDHHVNEQFTIKQLKYQILKLAEKENLNINGLTNYFKQPKEKIVYIVRILLSEGKLKINHQKQISINEKQT